MVHGTGGLTGFAINLRKREQWIGNPEAQSIGSHFLWRLSNVEAVTGEHSQSDSSSALCGAPHKADYVDVSLM